MKIAFLSFYSGQINRGVETVVRELAQRLAKNNEVIVFQTADNDFEINYKVKTFKTYINWDIKDNTTSLWRRLFIDYWSIKIGLFSLRILPEIFRGKFDVVVPLNGGWQSAFVRLVTWLYGGKMVISGQTGIGWDEKNNLMCFPNVYVALNSMAEAWAKKFNPLIRTSYIPNGVDLKNFTFKGSSFKVTLEKPIILAVGAFTEQKRLDLVIKAVAKLKNVSLLLVGSGGDLRDKIYDLGIRNLGKSRFEMLTVPFSEIPMVYRAADVFTLPSASSEAFGNVLIEAMASNIPVIAMDDPIRREIVGNAGILVDPTNVQEYSLSLRRALDTKWRDQPRKQAEKFSWDDISEKYEKLFKTLKK